MESLHLAVPEEIALEGLDGITLDSELIVKFHWQLTFVYLCCHFLAMWFRLSERLKIAQPLSQHFQNEVWKLILARKCFEYFEINEDRATPKRLDRREYYFNSEIPNEVINEYMRASYYIYSYSPVNDPLIRGSCKEFETRKRLGVESVKVMSLNDIKEK